MQHADAETALLRVIDELSTRQPRFKGASTGGDLIGQQRWLSTISWNTIRPPGRTNSCSRCSLRSRLLSVIAVDEQKIDLLALQGLRRRALNARSCGIAAEQGHTAFRSGRRQAGEQQRLVAHVVEVAQVITRSPAMYDQIEASAAAGVPISG